MKKKYDNNFLNVNTSDSVDKLNARFYEKFPYPWPPMKFVILSDPSFETTMLNQNLGYWADSVIPKNPKIWVAGCGTNQAIITALKFPEAAVLGSDISTKSLEICSNTSKDMGISNLELKEESLNKITYKEKFDYIISTGTVHHNLDPEATLKNLANALKPTGIMELMVYNKYNWSIPAAIQKTIKILSRFNTGTDFNSELSIAKKIIDVFSKNNSISDYLQQFKSCPESLMADALLQPILHSYTIETLEKMSSICGLELLIQFVNLFDRANNRLSWDMEFDDLELQKIYDALPDIERWQVTNLLLSEKSPFLLWFYLQRKDSGRKRKTEKQICDEFLDTKFKRAHVNQKNYVRQKGGKYKLSSRTNPYPSRPIDPSVKSIVDAITEKRIIREIFDELKIETDFYTVNQARVKLTTTEFPYLVSC